MMLSKQIFTKYYRNVTQNYKSVLLKLLRVYATNWLVIIL